MLWSALFFVLAMIVGLIVAIPIIHYLTSVEPVKGMELNAFSPWDGIRIYMQVAVYVSFAISMPFILFQVWLFVKPGLREIGAEGIIAIHTCCSSIVRLRLILCLLYCVPNGLLLHRYNDGNLGLTQTYGLAQYLTFMFNIIIPVSLMFELPIVVMFLTKLRILNPMRLNRLRRYAYLVLLIISALITPPDLISAFIVCIPMIILYEISLLLSRSIIPTTAGSRPRLGSGVWGEVVGYDSEVASC